MSKTNQEHTNNELVKKFAQNDITQYATVFGNERALGYLNAMEQVLNDVKEMFDDNTGTVVVDSSPHIVRTRLKKYHKEIVAKIVTAKKYLNQD